MDTATPIERFARWFSSPERGRQCLWCKTYVPNAKRGGWVYCSDECEREHTDARAI